MAVFGFDDVANHANMLLDRSRVRAFADAIAAVVRPGDIVADVGSGTGILAILAAKAGARRVFAVERGPLATEIAHAARDNGVENVVEVLRMDARDVAFPELPNVVVSETLGSFGIDEDILGLLKTVRGKVRDDCKFIPASFEIEMSLAFIPALALELDEIDRALPVRLPGVRAALTSRVAVAHIAESELLSVGAPAGVVRVGYDELPRLLSCTLPGRSEAAPAANAVVAWFRAQLADGVSLRSGPGPQSPSWAQVVFPLEPSLPIAADQATSIEVRPRLATDRGTWAWSARCGDEVRRGDAMASLVGDKTDWLEQLGIRTEKAGAGRSTMTLAQWNAALEGGPASVEEMARRLLRAFPTRYADEADATQEVLRLMLAAERSQ